MAAKRRYAKLRQPGGEQGSVGAVNLPGREGLPGLHHFVPGGEQPHFGPASHGYLCEAGAGQYAKGSGVQPGACREQQAARSVVLTLIDIIFIRGEGGVDSYRVTQISVLLAEYAVTALGQHGSRHDADGLSGQKRGFCFISRIQGIYHRQTDGVVPVRPGDVSRAESIAVQRGAVKRWLVNRGSYVRCQGTAQSLKGGQCLRSQGGQFTGYQLNCLFQRNARDHSQHPLPKGQMG